MATVDVGVPSLEWIAGNVTPSQFRILRAHIESFSGYGPWRTPHEVSDILTKVRGKTSASYSPVRIDRACAMFVDRSLLKRNGSCTIMHLGTSAGERIVRDVLACDDPKLKLHRQWRSD